MSHLEGGLQTRRQYLDLDSDTIRFPCFCFSRGELSQQHPMCDMEINSKTIAKQVPPSKCDNDCLWKTKDNLNLNYQPVRRKLLSVLHTISKSNISFSTCAALIFLVAVLSCPKLTEGHVQGTEQRSRDRMPPMSISCYRHFGHKVESCVEPFKSLLDLFDAKVYTLSEPVAVAKHICLEYQMVLLCLHSALTDCPTEKNLKRVQTTLDSNWVARINGLCSIQSESSRQIGSESYNDLANYIYKKNFPNHVDSSQIADEILQASVKTRARLGEEIISAQSKDKFGATLPESRRRLSPTLQREMDYLDHRKSGDSSRSGTNVQLSIMNFINNYYDAKSDQERAKPVKTRFVPARYSFERSGANTSNRLSVTFVLVLGMFCSFLMSWQR